MFIFFINNIKNLFISISVFFNLFLLTRNKKLKLDNYLLENRTKELEVKNDIQQKVIDAVDKIESSDDINDNIKRMRNKNL